jgi:hypothetical protein
MLPLGRKASRKRRPAGGGPLNHGGDAWKGFRPCGPLLIALSRPPLTPRRTVTAPDDQASEDVDALDLDLDFALELGDLSTDGVDELALDLDAFAGEGDLEAETDNRYVLPPRDRSIPQRFVRYERAAEFAREICPAIVAGETIHAMLSGNFIFGDLFEALSVENAAPLEDVTLSTLSFGQDNVDSFANLLNVGWMRTLNIVVSDYFWSHNRHNAPYIYEHLDKGDRFQLAVAGVHTKIACVLTEAGTKLVIHGSANLRSSRSLEVVTIETNPALYDFHLEWHRRILENYATIRKPLRAHHLYDHLTKGRPAEWR